MRWRWAAPLAAAAAGWAGVNAALQWRAFGARRWGTEAGRGWTPQDVGLAHEVIPVRTADGVDLLAWLLPGRGEGMIVISGGYRGRAGDVLGIGGALNRAGFTVLTFGWRGTPGSGAGYHTMGVLEQRDLRAVMEAGLARTGDVPVGLLGFSMGASVSIAVAADDRRVLAVCADSPFTTPADALADGIRRTLRLPPRLFLPAVGALVARRTGARLDDLRPIDDVAAIAPRPLLIIHGEEDEAIPVDHARRLREAAGPTAQLWLVPGAVHVGGYFGDRSAYVDRVASFFREAFAGRRAEAPQVHQSRVSVLTE
jgi:alpha-beta hydrolase superfamily lysophospholipase